MKDARMITSIFNTYTNGCAVIAGGYVRDTILGRQPKDIDILVQYFGDVDYDELRILASRLGYGVLDCSMGYEVNDTDQLRVVFKLFKVGELTIDVIFLNCSPMERIRNFPCNASMVWLEDYTVYESPRFTEFKNTGVLEFYETATVEYKERMNTYFPQTIRHTSNEQF